MANEALLAFYMGYAFCHGVNVQHVLAPNELSVPYVVYWQGEQPSPTPYAAQTQAEAVNHAIADRAAKSATVTGWSSGWEVSVRQSDGTKLDAMLIDGWVPGLSSPVEMMVYIRKDPFRLVRGFMWKLHPEARKDAHTFMQDFQRGMLSQPFGQQCLRYVEGSEAVQYVR